MNSNSHQKIIVIVGPTASGKSDVAVHLAKQYRGEVISADSRQVYKNLDIGTGKITTREMRGVPHHLLDVCSPKKVFTAHEFVTRAQQALPLIAAANKVPIVVGGTGFYIDALLGNVSLAQIPRNDALRKKLQEKTTAQLLTLLKRKNKKRFDDILQKNEQNNRVRLIRAIEVASTLSTPMSRVPLDIGEYNALWIGISPSDDVLRQKIHARLLARLRNGMVAEARRLHTQGVSYKRMNQLGLEYRYLALYLQNKITKNEMIEQLENKIWQYARRQKTYWRRNKNIRWFALNEYEKIERAITDFLHT